MNIDFVKFDEKGLVPVITQENTTGEILMFAWMNRESLEKTLETGKMTYWSRSRQKLWLKGDTSGNFQEVVEALIDCDCDTLLFKVEQKGLQAACHNGYKSCFFRQINPSDGSLAVIAEKVFEPEDVYGK